MGSKYQVYSKQDEDELNKYCLENHIKRVKDEFYFELNGQKYRISRYSVTVSNSSSIPSFVSERAKNPTVYIKGKRSEVKQIYESIKDGSYFKKKEEEVKVKEAEIVEEAAKPDPHDKVENLLDFLMKGKR